jgi:hypothetical protein
VITLAEEKAASLAGEEEEVKVEPKNHRREQSTGSSGIPERPTIPPYVPFFFGRQKKIE